MAGRSRHVVAGLGHVSPRLSVPDGFRTVGGLARASGIASGHPGRAAWFQGWWSSACVVRDRSAGTSRPSAGRGPGAASWPTCRTRTWGSTSRLIDLYEMGSKPRCEEVEYLGWSRRRSTGSSGASRGGDERERARGRRGPRTGIPGSGAAIPVRRACGGRRRLPPCAESWDTWGAVGARCGSGRAEAAGVPGLRLGGRRRARGRRAGRGEEGRASSPTWRRSWSSGRCRPGRRASGTPGGPPTAGRPTRTRIRIWTTRGGSPSSTTASSRTSPRCAPSWPSAGTSWPPRPTPRSSRICSPRSSPSCGDLAEAMRLVCRRLEGAFTLVAVHADEPDVVVGRAPQLAARGGRRGGRGLPRLRRRRVHRAHPVGDRAGPGPGRRAAPGRGDASPTSTARPPRCASYHVDWDASAAEKGGYDYFMLKEIAEQPKAVADTLLGRIDASGSLHPRRGADLRRRAARGRQGRHRGVRDGVPRRADRQVRHRALDADPVRGRSWPASSATATRSWTGARWSSPSRSPARPWTP